MSTSTPPTTHIITLPIIPDKITSSGSTFEDLRESWLQVAKNRPEGSWNDPSFVRGYLNGLSRGAGLTFDDHAATYISGGCTLEQLETTSSNLDAMVADEFAKLLPLLARKDRTRGTHAGSMV
jgi:hypothetical protein